MIEFVDVHKDFLVNGQPVTALHGVTTHLRLGRTLLQGRSGAYDDAASEM